MQLKLDMSCYLLNVYTKFQIDISKHVEEKSGKRGPTDGQTDRHCHCIIRPVFQTCCGPCCGPIKDIKTICFLSSHLQQTYHKYYFTIIVSFKGTSYGGDVCYRFTLELYLGCHLWPIIGCNMKWIDDHIYLGLYPLLMKIRYWKAYVQLSITKNILQIGNRRDVITK